MGGGRRRGSKVVCVRVWWEAGWWGVEEVALRERDTLIFRNVRRVNVEDWRLGI